MPGPWGITPRRSVESECARVGTTTVVTSCVALLRGDRVDDGFLFVLGGPGARTVLDGREGGITGYWPRTWALRALLYAWDELATPAVLDATTDSSWRVREMAAKVIGRHLLDEGLDPIGDLLQDPMARVRTAATRARRRLTEAAS